MKSLKFEWTFNFMEERLCNFREVISDILIEIHFINHILTIMPNICHPSRPVNNCRHVVIMSLGCPSQCSGKGRCVNDICECIDGWSGDDCSSGNGYNIV